MRSADESVGARPRLTRSRRKRSDRSDIEDGDGDEEKRGLEAGVRHARRVPREGTLDPQAHEEEDEEGRRVRAADERRGPGDVSHGLRAREVRQVEEDAVLLEVADDDVGQGDCAA